MDSGTIFEHECPNVIHMLLYPNYKYILHIIGVFLTILLWIYMEQVTEHFLHQIGGEDSGVQ